MTEKRGYQKKNKKLSFFGGYMCSRPFLHILTRRRLGAMFHRPFTLTEKEIKVKTRGPENRTKDKDHLTMDAKAALFALEVLFPNVLHLRLLSLLTTTASPNLSHTPLPSSTLPTP